MVYNSRCILTCAMLHNFIIDEETRAEGDIDVMGNGDYAGANVDDDYCPTGIEEDYEEMEGISTTRTALVKFLKEHNYRRPQYNLLRNGMIDDT